MSEFVSPSVGRSLMKGPAITAGRNTHWLERVERGMQKKREIKKWFVETQRAVMIWQPSLNFRSGNNYLSLDNRPWKHVGGHQVRIVFSLAIAEPQVSLS